MPSVAPIVNAGLCLESEDYGVLSSCIHHQLIADLVKLCIDAPDTFAPERLFKTLDLYLESPILMDAFLPTWIGLLARRMHELLHEWNGIQNAESTEEAVCRDRLIDLAAVVAHFCKVRGSRSIIKYFPCGVAQVLPVLQSTLRLLRLSSIHESLWCAQYVMLQWSALVLHVPFELKRVLGGDSNGWAVLEDLLARIQSQLLTLHGCVMEAATLLLATFLKRPDATERLAKFMKWIAESIDNDQDTALFIGIGRVLTQLCKQSEASSLAPLFSQLSLVLRRLLSISERGNASTSLQKVLIKLRMHLLTIELVDRPADAPFSQRQESFQQLIGALGFKDSALRWTAAKSIRRIGSVLGEPGRAALSRHLISVLEMEMRKERGLVLGGLEASPATLHGGLLALGQLLNHHLMPKVWSEEMAAELAEIVAFGLQFDQVKGSYAVGSNVRDAACYVCWAWARSNSVDACESRSGNVHLQVHVDTNCVNSETSLGTGTLAAYSALCANVASKSGNNVLGRLLCMALFDREVAGRRAAAGALQELIGRVSGCSSVIPVIEHVNFFTLASLECSFTVHFPQVRELALVADDRFFFEHLTRVSLFSFDGKLRNLAAQALASFAGESEEDWERLIGIYRTSDDLYGCHGALLALTHFLRNWSVRPCSAALRPLLGVSVAFEQLSPKSLGYELLLEGHLELISVLAAIESPDAQVLSKWLSGIQMGLKMGGKGEGLRSLAAQALASLAQHDDNAEQGPVAKFLLTTCLVGVEKDRDSNAQKGHLAALGSVSVSFLRLHRLLLLKVLTRAAKQLLPINDIDRRCWAIKSLTRICQLPCAATELFSFAEWQSLRDLVADVLLCDYSVDARGDVGSKIRLAALDLCRVLAVPMAQVRDERLLGCLLQEAYGRLDRLRPETLKLLAELYEFEESKAASPFDEGFVSCAITACEQSPTALTGWYRGLVYACGGLDAELAGRCESVLKKIFERLGSGLFEELAMQWISSHTERRLLMPTVQTISKLASAPLFAASFPAAFAAQLTALLIPGTENIRKLMLIYAALLALSQSEPSVTVYLQEARQSSPYPAVRALLTDHLRQ